MVAAGVTSPTAYRGPAWASTTELIVRTADVELQVFGQPSRTFGIRVDNIAVGDITIINADARPVAVSLAVGHNQVCALYVRNADADLADLDEARTCINVVYLP